MWGCGGAGTGEEARRAQRPRTAGAEQEPRACSQPWHRGGRADSLCVRPAKARAAGSSLPMPAGRDAPRRSRPPPSTPADPEPAWQPARWAPCRPRGTSARARRCPPTTPTLQAALLTPGCVTSLRGEGGVPLPLPPEPTVEAIPLGSHAAGRRKQLFGLSDAQALQSSTQAAGLGAA